MTSEFPLARTTFDTTTKEEIYELEVLPDPPDGGGPPKLWVCVAAWRKGPGADLVESLVEARRALVEFALRLDEAKLAELHRLVGKIDDAGITLDLAQARQYARDVTAAVDALESALQAYEALH